MTSSTARNAARDAKAQAARETAAAELRAANASGRTPLDATAEIVAGEGASEADHAANASAPTSPAHLTVVPGSPRESSGDRRPALGDWEKATDDAHQAAEAASAPAPATPAAPRTPRAAAAPKPGINAKVTMDTRRPHLVAWMSEHRAFTVAEVCAADAPSPMSTNVCSYTLGNAKKPVDPKLAAALKEAGFEVKFGDISGLTEQDSTVTGYSVTPLAPVAAAPAKPKTTRAPKTPKPAAALAADGTS